MRRWILLSVGFVVVDAAFLLARIILRNTWAQRALGFMQWWVFLPGGRDQRHAAFVRDWHLLSEWQFQLDHLPSGRVLPCARAGQLHAESNR